MLLFPHQNNYFGVFIIEKNHPLFNQQIGLKYSILLVFIFTGI